MTMVAMMPMQVSIRRQTASGRIALALFVLAVIGLAAMPWWARTGTIRMVLELCCYIAVAQMWNLLAGYAGLVSVGQQAFMGAAGYALFVLAQTFGVNPFLAIFLSLLVPLVLAVPCYLLLHRLDGPYFAIGTWAVADIARLGVSQWKALGGGTGEGAFLVAEQLGLHQVLGDGGHIQGDEGRRGARCPCGAACHLELDSGHCP